MAKVILFIPITLPFHSTFRGIYQTLPIYGELVSVDRQFYEGTHYIEYKAVDDGGNVDSCSFRVTVTGNVIILM